jgi:PIN domain nuclease of toxin-antitoxin system
MVMLELTYLYEIGRITVRADAIFQELNRSIDLRICNLPFDRIVAAASKEAWTRDVFDRMVVSHAKTNDEAPLITADAVIAAHYPNVVW